MGDQEREKSEHQMTGQVTADTVPGQSLAMKPFELWKRTGLVAQVRSLIPTLKKQRPGGSL